MKPPDRRFRGDGCQDAGLQFCAGEELAGTCIPSVGALKRVGRDTVSRFRHSGGQETQREPSRFLPQSRRFAGFGKSGIFPEYRKGRIYPESGWFAAALQRGASTTLWRSRHGPTRTCWRDSRRNGRNCRERQTQEWHSVPEMAVWTGSAKALHPGREGMAGEDRAWLAIPKTGSGPSNIIMRLKAGFPA